MKSSFLLSQVVKERQTTTDTMFEPLGKIIDMLRAYGVVIPEESLVQLQELPDKWANTKRLSVMAIQQVNKIKETDKMHLKERFIEGETITLACTFKYDCYI